MKLSSFVLNTLLGTALLLPSCSIVDSVSNGACGVGRETIVQRVEIDSTTSILPTSAIPYSAGNKIYYQFDNGIARYFIYCSQNNICSKEHLNVEFQITTTIDDGTHTKFKIYGEVYYSAIFRPYTNTLLSDGVSISTPITSSVSVGLKQAYPDKPGEIEAFLTVQFPSLGTSSKDHEHLRKYMGYMKIDFTYDKHK